MGAQDWQSKPPKVHSPTVGATITINPDLAPIFGWGPGEAETINATHGGYPDQRLTIIINTIDTNARVLTFTGNFRSTGTLNTGGTADRRFVLVFVSDGIVWAEQSRTAAMA